LPAVKKEAMHISELLGLCPECARAGGNEAARAEGLENARVGNLHLLG